LRRHRHGQGEGLAEDAKGRTGGGRRSLGRPVAWVLLTVCGLLGIPGGLSVARRGIGGVLAWLTRLAGIGALLSRILGLLRVVRRLPVGLALLAGSVAGRGVARLWRG